MKSVQWLACASIVGVVSSLPMAVSRADEAAAPASPPIEKVTVTARRYEENLQNLPASATVISGDRLHDDGVQNSIDLGEVASTLNVNGTLGQRDNDIFTIRGQTQPFGGADPGVQTYFSEVPFNAGGPGTYYDLNKVQILNGPQGTLFGRNTTGGAILFEPNHPDNTLSASLSATGGSFNDQEFQGFVNVPIISDKLMVRIAGAAQTRDGFTDVLDTNTGRVTDADNENHSAFRVGVMMKPFSNFENYLLFDSYRSDTNGTSSILTAVAPGSPADVFFGPGMLPPGFTIQDFLLGQQFQGPRKATLDTTLFNETRLWGITDIATFALNDNLKIRNIFGYRVDQEQPSFDFDGSPFPALNVLDSRAWQTNSKQLTDEVQLQGHSFSRLEWILGYFYETNEPNGYAETERLNFQPPSFIQTTAQSDRSEAIFAQGTLDLSDWVKGLAFTAGGRYTWDHRSLDSITCPSPAVPTVPCPLPLPSGFVESSDFHAPTWTLALSYQADPDTMFYVTSRRGYKSGGFNAGAPPQFAEFDPEYITDIEVGAKRDWTIFGIPARTNIDAYRGNYTNIQKNDFACLDPSTGNVFSAGSAIGCFFSGGQTVVLTVNGAKATIQGIDFDSIFVPARGLQVRFAYSYTDASYGSFSTFSGNHKGDPFAYTPTNKFSISGRYHLPLDSWLGEPVLIASYSYQSRIWFSDFADLEPDSSQGAYGVLNLRGELRHVAGSTFDLGIFVNNATDETYKIGANALESTVGTTSSIYAPPRMWGLELTYNYEDEAH